MGRCSAAFLALLDAKGNEGEAEENARAGEPIRDAVTP
jgi:hypothetical protein